MERTVIVGASLAGVRTAQALRAADYRGQITLVGDETHLPYDRPALCKGVLGGGEVSVLLDADGARDLGVDLVLGRTAIAVDLVERRVVLDDDRAIGFDHLVAATGSRARPSPWEGSSGVHLMRTRGDAARLAADLEDGGRLLVVGAGFVGAEVAASARGLGLEVTLVDPQPAPLSRVLGEDVGSVFAALHSGHGVDTRFGVGVDTLTGGPGAWTAELTDGSSVLASTVLVCVGGQPNDEWLRSSGLEVEDGLCCDRFCRATRDDRVFAVGDVARWWHPRHGESVRIEHWTNAVEQAAVVAHNIVHAEDLRAHAPVEYVWSDQYDWKIQLVGRTQGTEPVMLGSPEDGRFAVAYPTAENLLVGLLAVNWPKAMLTGRRGIGQGMGLAELVDRLGLASGRTA